MRWHGRSSPRSLYGRRALPERPACVSGCHLLRLKDSGFTSFQIVDCCIITVPQLTQIGPKVPTIYSPPSPFLQSVGATYHLPLDFEIQKLLGEPADPPMRHIRQEWKHNLDVGYAAGRWELSFVITVRIMRGEDVQPELRVFSFDPESSVGGESTL